MWSPGSSDLERREKEFQSKIYDILRSSIHGKKFNDVSFSNVKQFWEIVDKREADLVIFGPGHKDIFLIIETKRKEHKLPALVIDKAHIGQALSYAVLAKKNLGYNVYFIGVANPYAIAIYKVPDDVENIVNWDAIDTREYDNVIPSDKLPEFFDQNKYAVFTRELVLSEEFFQKLIDDLVKVSKLKQRPDQIQPFTYKVIEEFRGFVNWLSQRIEPLVRNSYGTLLKRHEEQVKKIGYNQLTPERLAREMSYVLMNKILFYKVLEKTWNIKPLEQLYNKIINGVKIDTATKYINTLYGFFKDAIEITGNFEPIFITGIYDDLILPDDPEVLRGIDAFIGYIELIDIQKLGDVIGYVYEDLIPAQERHVLGQFYTPPAVSRLIARWCIRSQDDVCLGPGSGSGTFEVEGYKRLFKLKTGKEYGEVWPSSEVHKRILSQIYALDIDEFAAHLTAMNLAMRNVRVQSSNMNVFVGDFFTIGPCTETFVEHPVKTFGSEGEVKKKIHVPKVDVVWGNPPYTRWQEIPESTQGAIKGRLSSEIKNYDLGPAPTRGKEPGIYIYWVMHATKFLKEGGRLGMIISNMWLQTDYGINFGRFLLDNYKIKALIDVSFKLFEAALISTVIILAEKCSGKEKEVERNENETLFIHIPAGVEKLGEVLEKIDEYLEGRSRELPPGILINKVKQKDIPRDKKWISLFFPKVEEIVKEIEQHPLMIKASSWFEPSYGNALYLCLTSWGIVKGVRNLGSNEFFYFKDSKAKNWNIPNNYLISAITKAQYVKTFTFTKEDWNDLKNKDEDAYMFICHKPKNQLEDKVPEYIRWGEPVCPKCGARFDSEQINAEGYFRCVKGHEVPSNVKCITSVRGTRGGGRSGGRIASAAEASKARQKHGYPPFYDWYDLGGYIPTPLMAIYQARYRPQFFLSTIPVVTYHAIITFIPKVRVETSFMKYNPKEYEQYLREIKPNKTLDEVTLDEVELKAILAYLNSTFNWLWLEQNGRYIAKGPIALEVNVARNMPILNVKTLNRNDVEELAKLFDELEENARRIIQSSKTREKEGKEEIGGPKLEMIKQLKPIFKKIDEKIAKILGINIDVDLLWEFAWQMMERRVKGARETARPGASEDVAIRRRERRSSSGSTKTLDEYF